MAGAADRRRNNNNNNNGRKEQLLPPPLQARFSRNNSKNKDNNSSCLSWSWSSLNVKRIKSWVKYHGRWSEMTALLTDPKKLPITGAIYLLFELILNLIIIQKVPYTEIDWKAYMQEVAGFLNGTLDYGELRGETGPLVYPAGFTYIYSLLYYATSRGSNIRLAQYVFAVLHVVLLALVLRIYAKAQKVPPYALVFIFATSYRIHSILVLRLFNDPIAMALLYASLNAYLDERPILATLLYTTAVSVKMNVLLFAPALLAYYLTNLGTAGTCLHLAICASVQIILGLPFLLVNPLAYLRGAFDLGRVFDFQWTVNWRFLPQELFLHSHFHLALLLLHLATLLYLAPLWLKYLASYAKLSRLGLAQRPRTGRRSFIINNNNNNRQHEKKQQQQQQVDTRSVAQLFLLPLFSANFVGMAFSRSLHYQFYVWYYHSLPYLLWCMEMPNLTRFVLMGIVELSWNTSPSTLWSSLSLHFCHIVMLHQLRRIKLRTFETIQNTTRQT